MFGSDPAHTGHRPHGTAPTEPVGPRWRVETGDRLWNVVDSSPAVVDGTLFVGSRGGPV